MLSKGDGVGIIPSLCEDVMVKVVSLLCVIGLQPGQGGGPAALRYLLLHMRHAGCGGPRSYMGACGFPDAGPVGATCFGGFNPN